jgi:hypothetical protein
MAGASAQQPESDTGAAGNGSWREAFAEAELEVSQSLRRALLGPLLIYLALWLP